MNRIACLGAAMAIVAGLATAQESRSTILGTVKDAQGAAVVGATVVVTNAATNTSVRVTSNDTGYYEAPLLLPGPYTVAAEFTGFKKIIRSGIVLQLSDRREVDLTLDVGAITESVSVTAEAPLVDVSRTDAGRVLDSRSVQDLPVMANTVFTMIRYAAGVQGGGPPILLGPHSTQGGSDYNNGTGVGGNAWTIDGAVNDGNARFTANLPSVDAVSETKVLTTTFDGSFGHSTGLGIAVMTKTGTNQFHGTASETYWNQRWQGTNLFTKRNFYSNIASLNAKGDTAGALAAASKPMQPAGHSNLWTLNATGPIWIPKIFNGRDKVFFSFNYNGEKDAKPEESSTYNRVVPTAANKKGDFSDLLQVQNGAQFQLYDPFSTKADRSGHYLRTPIPGNILPASYINMGKKFYDSYVKYWPDPNNWFDKTKIPNVDPFLSITAPYNWDFRQYSGRMDVNLGEKMRMFGRYTQNHFVEFRGDWTIDILPGLNNQNAAGSGVTRDDQNGVLDWIYTLSPSTILHAAASISNWDSLASVGATPFQFKPSDVGLPTYLDDKCANSRCYLPLMAFSGTGNYSQNGISGIPNPVYNRFNTENADLYHNRRNHSLRFGLDIRQQIRSIHAGNNDGQYTFSNTYFRQCDDSCANGTYSAGTIGLSWAAFMMGLPNGISISGNDSAYVRNPYYAWFAQDTWRVTPKFTLTLSLRGEYEQGATERYNRLIIDYDKNLRLPISDLAEAAYAKNPIPELAASQFKVQGGAVYANASGAPDRAWSSQLMWLPRVGFGYQVNSKTVVRGGYGVYYDTLNVNAISFGPNQTGYSRGTSTTVDTNVGGVPVYNSAWNVAGLVSPLTDPFPTRATSGGTRFDTPVRDTLGNMALAGNGNAFGNVWTYPADKHPRQQRWRVGIERQIGASNVIEAAYEGTYASDLNINVSQSLIPSTYYSRSTVRDATQDTNLGTSVPNPFALANFASLATSNPAVYQDMTTKTGFYSASTSKANLIRQYPGINVTVPYPLGKARTQQFELSFNRRFSRGLTANFAYTAMIQKQATSFFQPWSPFDSASPQAPYWQRGGASPQRVAATWVYDLPFGKGRQFVHNAIASQIVGGWTLAGTYEWSPGGLLNFGAIPSGAVTGNYFYYGDPSSIKIDNPTFDHYFNTSGCVTSNPGPGDTVVAAGLPCAQGWDKRTGSQPATYQARTFPYNIDGLRGPGYQQWNASVSRSFQIREGLTFQCRLDALNVLNHSFIAGPSTTPTASNFGQITSGAANLNRFIQIQGRLRW
jgi:hypothetical protein